MSSGGGSGSGYNLHELAAYAYYHCQPYRVDWRVSSYLVVFRHSELFAAIVLYGATFVTGELLLLLFGFGLTYDWAVNTLLRRWFDVAPFLAGCGRAESSSTYGASPSPVAQNTTFFVVTMLPPAPLCLAARHHGADVPGRHHGRAALLQHVGTRARAGRRAGWPLDGIQLVAARHSLPAAAARVGHCALAVAPDVWLSQCAMSSQQRER